MTLFGIPLQVYDRPLRYTVHRPMAKAQSKAVLRYINRVLVLSALLFASVTLAAPPEATTPPPAATPPPATPPQVRSPPPVRTLHDSGDPTLALTPGLRGAEKAPPGTPPGNPDPHDLNGVWWLSGYQYLLGPEPGVAPPLKPEYMAILERRIRAKNRGTPEADASTQCLPHGMPRIMESPYPIEIVQTPERIT